MSVNSTLKGDKLSGVYLVCISICYNLSIFIDFFTEKILPPLFPSQIHIQHDIKMPIMPAHQSVPHSQQQQHAIHQHQLVTHAPQQQIQTSSANSHHDVHINAGAQTPQPNEHYISISQTHPTHLPHVSNLSRHLNAK